MLLKPAWFLVGVSAVMAACGGNRAPAETAPAEAPSAAQPEASAEAEPKADTKSSPAGDSGSSAVPTGCYKSSGLCVPDPKFVRKLCNTRNASMAIYLFGNGSKFARGYLTRKTEAINASGGASAGGYLEFDEEVLILAERKPDLGGMQVSGAGSSYDALRWDGSCVTLSSEEVTQTPPPSPKVAHIEWRFLDDNVQEALRKDPKVNSAYLERRKECKGAVSGDVSLKCVKADNLLSESIVRFLRASGQVPVPTSLP